MSVKTWWLALIGVSLVNICAWFLAGVLPVRRAVNDPALATRRRQVLLSAPFVFGCAFRSIFPRADVQRICVVDSWLSAVVVGRTVATIAELGFAAQCALLLRVLAADARKPAALGISRVIVPLIAMAETVSWYAVITTNYVGNTIEESTWASGGDAADRRARDGAAAPARVDACLRRSGDLDLRRLRRVHVRRSTCPCTSIAGAATRPQARTT